MTNPIIVLGAGIAGLGAAYKLSKENQCIIVLEKMILMGDFVETLPLMVFVLTVLSIFFFKE